MRPKQRLSFLTSWGDLFERVSQFGLSEESAVAASPCPAIGYSTGRMAETSLRNFPLGFPDVCT